MAGLIPDDLDALLTRVDCAAALSEAGFPTSPKTLATKASRGGGPPFRRWGSKPLYPWGSSLSWAMERLGPPMRSTSEADAWKRERSHGTDQAHVAPPSVPAQWVPSAQERRRLRPRSRTRIVGNESGG
jgi:hypothetical protein